MNPKVLIRYHYIYVIILLLFNPDVIASELSFYDLSSEKLDSLHTITYIITISDDKSPEGSVITLYAFDGDELTFFRQKISDHTGLVIFNDIVSGIYSMKANYVNADQWYLSNFEIDQDRILEIELQAILNIPRHFHTSKIRQNDVTFAWEPPEYFLYDTILYEGFEDGEIPPGWSFEFLIDSIEWTINTGGSLEVPDSAHSGTYNATFPVQPASTRLVTPMLNLENYYSKISFWYAQPESETFSKLRVEYKTSLNGEWIPIFNCLENVPEWNPIVSFFLPTEISDTCYFGFTSISEDQSNMGISLDDICIQTLSLPDPEINGLIGYIIYASNTPPGPEYITDTFYTMANLIPNDGYCIEYESNYGGGPQGYPMHSIFFFTHVSCDSYPPPKSLSGIITDSLVHLTWKAPDTILQNLAGYNIYKNDSLMTFEPMFDTNYYDYISIGETIIYNITAIHQIAESCINSASISITLPVAIQDNEYSDLKIYPNPLYSTLHIKSGGNLKWVGIYNSLGKRLTQQSNITQQIVNIDISGYSSGLFIIKCIDVSGKIYVRKIFKF